MSIRPFSWQAVGKISRWLAQPILGLGLSAIFVLIAVRRLSWAEIGGALAGVEGSILCLALVFLAAGYSARITRWWFMLRVAAPDLHWHEAAAPFLVGVAANNVLPLRIGDVLRLFAFRGRPGLEASRVGSTLLLERLLDVIALLAIFAVASQFVPASENGAAVARIAAWVAASGVLALGGLMMLAGFGQRVIRDVKLYPALRTSVVAGKALDVIFMVADTLRTVGRPSHLVALALLSALAWILEGGVFVAAARAAGVPLDLAGAFFALAIATLSTMLPSSPGYVGTFHFFAMQAALAFGALAPAAAAFAIVAHLMLWAPTTIVGALIFATKRRGIGFKLPADGGPAP